MRTRNLFLALGAAVLAIAAGGARAELIELANGHVLQGKIMQGQTTDEGLAVELFDTNGVVIVKWDHIVESRRKQLRRENGIDLPEETIEQVDGHRVLLTTGEWITGVAENPRDSAPLRMRTRTGVKEFDRSTLAGKVEDAKIDGLLVYSPEELYQRIRNESPPETAYAHKALAQKCVNIGAFEHAKDHLLAAKADAGFMETQEGRAVEGMLRQCEVMIRSKGAQDLVQQIKLAMSQNRFNDALTTLNKLDADAQYKDDVIRNAIGFDNLEARVVKARDTWFQRQIAFEVYKVMDDLIEKKAREKKPLRPDPAGAPGAAAVGTLAAARQWENRELFTQLWDKVGADLGLTKDEMEKYWKARSVKTVRRSQYGTGSFIVVKKAATAKSPGGEAPRRRPPSGDSSGKNAPARPVKVDKPLTDEEWWEAVGPSDRKSWLIANFVETSNLFDIVKNEQPQCPSCGGAGFTTSTGTDGQSDSTFCKQCNTSGVFRSVSYR